MFGDIVGFIIVTLLLILIDSFILCEHQNTTRILFSIGIDYIILFVYIAARNVAIASEPSAASQPQYGTHKGRAMQQDCK